MKSILFLAMLFFLATTLNGQFNNEVSTNPSNPTNLALPDLPGTNNTPDERYLNGFKWWDVNQYQLTDMYYNSTVPYSNMSNFQSPNISEYYRYLNPGLEGNGAGIMTPENGWELILVNLGYYPDNQNTHEYIDLNALPYVVLYNRYSGILRVFVQYGENVLPSDAIDGIRINLLYDLGDNSNNLTGILRLGKGIDKALDRASSVTTISSYAPANGTVNFWLSTDFQLHYDPCACLRPTELKLDFTAISSSNIDLVGRALTVNVDSIFYNNEVVENNILGNIDYTNGSIGNPNETRDGFIVYKEMERLISDYIEKLEQYELELASNNVTNGKINESIKILKVLKKILEVGITAVTGSSEFISLVTEKPWFDFKPKDTTAAAKEDAKKKTKNFYKAASKIMGEFSSFFRSKNLTAIEGPTKPEFPTIAFTEMSFRGNINDIQSLGGPLFYTPGSYKIRPNEEDDVTSVYEYPVYNDPVGIFALMRTPKLKTSYSHGVHYQNRVNEGNFMRFFTSEISDYQFALEEPLVFKFNEALDIESYEILAQLETKITEPTPSNEIIIDGIAINGSSNVTINDLRTVSNTSGTVNQSSYQVNESTESVYGYEGIYYNSPNSTIFPQNLVGNEIIFGPPIDTSSNANISFLSEKVSLSTFSTMVSQISFKNQMTATAGYAGSSQFENTQPYLNSAIKEFSHKLKLEVNVTFLNSDSNGEKVNETFLFTYDIPKENITTQLAEIFPNLVGSSMDYSQYPVNMVLQDIVFDGQTIDGCKLINNKYVCKSREYIYLYGDLSTVQPYSVDIIAGEEIIQSSESQINGEISTEIQEVYDESFTLEEISTSALYDFCSSNEEGYYQANIFENKSFDNYKPTVIYENMAVSGLRLNLYPNPTSNYVNVKLSHPTDILSFKMYDLSGREVPVTYELLKQDGAKVSFEGLQQGVYTLITETVSGSFTNKIVVDAGRAN